MILVNELARVLGEQEKTSRQQRRGGNESKSFCVVV
jgi:hypothetical protein